MERKNKAETEMFEGIWLGVGGRTGEVPVGTTVGAVNCRTIKRPPEPERCGVGLGGDERGRLEGEDLAKLAHRTHGDRLHRPELHASP